MYFELLPKIVMVDDNYGLRALRASGKTSTITIVLLVSAILVVDLITVSALKHVVLATVYQSRVLTHGGPKER